MYRIKTFFIKLFSWEYWPIWVVYFPTGIYYAYLSVRARSFFFFSASNPSIETGGMFFESKWKIFELLPKSFYPSTIYVAENDSLAFIQERMLEAEIRFPIIAKPDRGERGWAVLKIESVLELEAYRSKVPVPFLIQNYVDHPLEFSIFYFRKPGSSKGKITSVTLKKLLTVTGNGVSTVEELILEKNRSFLQYQQLKKDAKLNLQNILEKGEQLVLVPYGNHVRGAMFLNYQHIIDAKLEAVFDQISKSINGFYFGRFDIRCTSIEDLKEGKNISILELNGAGAEPAHIYDPGFSFFKAQYVIASHYRMMFEAAIANNQSGTAFMSFEAYRSLKKSEKAYKEMVQF